MAQQTTTLLARMTLGEVVRKYRKEAQLTLAQLGQITGFNKGVLSKIENGETKRPEIRTIKAIAYALGIPYETILAHYIDVEQRTDALRGLLSEAIEMNNIEMASKVALRYMESPYIETDEAISYVYVFTEKLQNLPMRLALYGVMIKFARSHGLQLYLAKSMLQKYLIERDDFTRLADTYQSGRSILDYSDFLSATERILAYYKLGLHAFNLKLYKDCIDLCERGFREDYSTSQLKAGAVLAICSSYWKTDNDERALYYLDVYETFTYPQVASNVRFTRGILNARQGRYEEAEEQLRQCLAEASQDNRMHIVNMLLDIALTTNNLADVEPLLENEADLFPHSMNTPFKYAELGAYYRHKGTFLIRLGKFDEGIDSYLQSILAYNKVSAYEEINECMELIFLSHRKIGKNFTFQLLENLETVYNQINKKNGKER